MLEVLSTNRDLEDKVMKGETMFKVDIERLPSFQIGEQRGEQRGEQKAMSKVAKNLLSKNNDITFIVDITGLTIQEIEKLQEEKEI